MSRISDGEVPARLEAVRRRFEDWRRGHPARSRLPERLWVSAVELGRTYGINRTARALRLDYYSLKRRVESSPPSRVETSSRKRVGSVHYPTPRRKAVRRRRKVASASSDPANLTSATLVPGGSAPATFLEVGPLPSVVTGEWIVELEDGEGARMRVSLKGAEAIERAASGLAALARSFWGVR